ncbi:hypothetical protein V5799_017827 [Amblyomma americanum]|uniref:Uncharacterized protein n=1 Tax=Amblyomma americanum TaxID=6943 RepID=A0AAQ4F241_AMBAM
MSEARHRWTEAEQAQKKPDILERLRFEIIEAEMAAARFMWLEGLLEKLKREAGPVQPVGATAPGTNIEGPLLILDEKNDICGSSTVKDSQEIASHMPNYGNTCASESCIPAQCSDSANDSTIERIELRQETLAFTAEGAESEGARPVAGEVSYVPQMR